MGTPKRPSYPSTVEASRALRAHCRTLRSRSEALLHIAGETLSRGELTLDRARRAIALCQTNEVGDGREVREVIVPGWRRSDAADRASRSSKS